MKRPSPETQRQLSLFDQIPRSNNRPDTGESRRDAAHALHEKYRTAYLLKARRVLLNVLLQKGTATADDVRDALTLPGWIDPKLLEAVPGALVKAKIIRESSIAKSRRPEAHARQLSVWELVDRDAVLRWLSEHPEEGDA